MKSIGRRLNLLFVSVVTLILAVSGVFDCIFVERLPNIVGHVVTGAEIARRVESIARLAEEPSVAMNRTATSARTVKQLVETMHGVVSGFKV